ncbi:MAG: hypothetical protein K2M23_00170 [Alphaproteobacteria bacterium]|nr:hypothetical protein [Alphaproteobacteria bacterium]
MIVATIVVFSQNLVNAAPRKKAVRAASNKRAATNSSSSASKPVSKRAATNKRAVAPVTARVGSRSLRGNAKNGDAKMVDTTTTSSTKNVCPIGVMLKKVLGSNGVATYYSAKNTVCALPEDNVSVVNQWVKADSSSYPVALQKHPSWMSDREAVYLTCTSGYVEKTVNKVKTCVMASGICPLGEIVEKSGDGFIHPLTRETCVIPENAVTSNVRGEENTLSYSVADDNAYKFECPSNYYSILTNTSPALRVGCVACPNEYSAPVGAMSASECGKETEVAKEPEVKQETVVTVEPQVSEVDDAEAKRLAKLRIKKVEGTSDDYTCVDGWTNNWTYDEIASKTYSECKSYFRVGFIMDKDGIIKNVVDRNTYGKNKRGCPIKLDKYLYNYFSDRYSESVERTFYYDKSFSPGNISFGWCPNSVNVHYLTNILNGLCNITVVLCPSVSDNNYTIFKPKFGVLKKQMTSSDIDNTGVNGWTEEEYNAWGGYRPILGGYYDLSTLEGREASSKSCSELSSEYYYPIGILASDIEKAKKDYSEKNLFTYWD